MPTAASHSSPPSWMETKMAKSTKDHKGIQGMLARATSAPSAGGADPMALKAARKQLDSVEASLAEAKNDNQRLVKALESIRSEQEGVAEHLPLEDFIEPPWNCWKTTDKRIRELAEDIRRRGLLEPILIDVENIVLAGKHRVLALRQLQEQNPAWFTDALPQGVPYFRHDISYRTNPFEAGLLQLAANFNRAKTPTAQELRPHLLSLLEKMPHEVYHFGKGNPGKKQPVIPTLMDAFGVSRRTIARALAKDDATASDIVNGGEEKGGGSRLIRLKRVVKQASALTEMLHDLPPDVHDEEIRQWQEMTKALLRRMDRLVVEERAAR